MFGTKVEFSGLADRVNLLAVEPNPRGGESPATARDLGKFRTNIGISLECVI